MGITYNLTGQKFGRLTVLRRGERDRLGRPLWECACDCGGITASTTTKLISGAKKSCGCARPDAFMAYVEQKKAEAKYRDHARARRIWKGMLSRCHNPADTSFKDYGGRGIFVCDEWHDWDAFLRDMGDPPPGFSIDRLDNNRGYSKENCRWATSKQQARNRRGNIRCLLDAPGHEGREYVVADVAEILGISPQTLYSRFHAAIRSIELRYS